MARRQHNARGIERQLPAELDTADHQGGAQTRNRGYLRAGAGTTVTLTAVLTTWGEAATGSTA